MTISVQTLSPFGDEILLNGFLDSLSEESTSVLGYHYPFYQQMLVETGVGSPLILGAFSDGKLIGILPAFEKTSERGTVVSSLPFFGPNGGVLCGLRQKREIHDALICRLLEEARSRNVISCSIYTPFLSEDSPLYDHAFPGDQVVEKFSQFQYLSTFETDREPSVERNLRKANRIGIIVSTEVSPDRLDKFYKIYEQNCIEFTIPIKPRACISFLAQNKLIGHRTRLYFAIHKNRIIGALMVIWSQKVASYYIPCSLPEERSNQPGPLLIDFAMKEARNRDIQLWNWESSPSRNSGVYNFKKKWGARECDYRIYIHTFAGHEVIKSLGREGIIHDFPYFFVWPFNNI